MGGGTETQLDVKMGNGILWNKDKPLKVLIAPETNAQYFTVGLSINILLHIYEDRHLCGSVSYGKNGVFPIKKWKKHTTVKVVMCVKLVVHTGSHPHSRERT